MQKKDFESQNFAIFEEVEEDAYMPNLIKKSLTLSSAQSRYMLGDTYISEGIIKELWSFEPILFSLDLELKNVYKQIDRVKLIFHTFFNTQFMTNPTLIYPVKMKNV